MPSDANGVFSLVPGYQAEPGETIQPSQHNPPLEDIATALTQRLMRTGAAPMTGPLKLVDGSSSSPAICFNSDAASGIYKTTRGIGVAIAGTKIAEFTSSGVSRMIGEMVPWARLTAPDGWILLYGQTLSRTAYPDLWAVAQTEIAAGNTFFNNGDGSTTFGVGDVRGRVVAGKDNMGGTGAGRLRPDRSGITGTTLGAAGGEEMHQLTQEQLPITTLTFTGTQGVVAITQGNNNLLSGTALSNQLQAGDSGIVGAVNLAIGKSLSGFFTPSGTISTFGSNVAHNNVQPTIVTNYIMYAGA